VYLVRDPLLARAGSTGSTLKAAKQVSAPVAFSETLDRILDRVVALLGSRRGSIGLSVAELPADNAGGDVTASSGQFLIE
jgi:hypothetical protein